MRLSGRDRLYYAALGAVVGIVAALFVAVPRYLRSPLFVHAPQAVGSAALSGGVKVFLDFEQKKDLRHVKRVRGLTARITGGRDMQGLYHLTTQWQPPFNAGLEFLFVDEEALDSRGWDALAFDVVNEGEPVTWAAEIKSGKNYQVKTWQGRFVMPSGGPKTIRLPLESVENRVDRDALAAFRFWPIEGRPTRVRWDNFRFVRGKTTRSTDRTAAGRNDKDTGASRPDENGVAAESRPVPAVHAERNNEGLRFTVDPSRETRRISPSLWGVNLSAKMEFEKDVMDFARRVGIRSLRFPGGGSNGYRWQTGRFDFEERSNEAPLSEIKNVVVFARAVGAELVLTVNVESGTPEEAAAWVRAMRETYHFPVTYWELGNEVYGDWDRAFMSGEDYARLVREYASAMKAVDPGVKIGANVGGPNYPDFDEAVVRGAGDVIDFLSFHWYPNHVSPRHPFKGRAHPRAKDIMANAEAVPELMRYFRSLVERAAPARAGKIEVGFLEWDGSWDAPASDLRQEGRGMIWSLANGLFTADALAQMAREGVTLAHQFTFQEIMFGFIRGWDAQAGWGGSRWDGEIIRPKALAFQLLATRFGDTLVAGELSGSPVYRKKPDWRADSYVGDVPYVTAYASRFTGSSRLALLLINKHADQSFRVTVDLRDFRPRSSGKAWVLTGPGLEAQNDGMPGTVKVEAYELMNVKPRFQTRLPPASVTVLWVEGER